MRFQVPQFIETEEKIFGPFTLKQFIFVAIGGALIFFAFLVAPFTVFIFLAIPIGLISVGLALVKIDEVPVYLYLFLFLNFLLNPKKYLYRSDSENDPNQR